MTDELAAAIALLPGAAELLLADHVDDGRGRCRRCTLWGESGHYLWPCRLHDLARRSLALAARSSSGPAPPPVSIAFRGTR
jgi:hypothetical protein